MDYKKRKRKRGLLPHQQFCNDLPLHNVKNNMVAILFCFASNYLYAILHHFLQNRRATPLTKNRALYLTHFVVLKCQRCYFPLVFLFLFFLFLPESKYKYTTTTDGETITFEVLDTISEVPAQFVYRLFQNIFYRTIL